MILKDEVLYPSNPFQHAAELILEFKGREEPFLFLQQDGGYDYNPTTSRSIWALLIIAFELELEHVIAIKNAGGCSIYNPIERPMSSINLCYMGLALAYEELSIEVEEGIRKCKSIQEFVEKNRDNEKVINEYKESIQLPIDAINQAVS